MKPLILPGSQSGLTFNSGHLDCHFHLAEKYYTISEGGDTRKELFYDHCILLL